MTLVRDPANTPVDAVKYIYFVSREERFPFYSEIDVPLLIALITALYPVTYQAVPGPPLRPYPSHRSARLGMFPSRGWTRPELCQNSCS